jgi:O-antigen/teichoic acid export membrane protein
MTLALMSRYLFQALVVLFLTRALGATQFGAFVATLATTRLFFHLAGFGSNTLMVKRVSRNPKEHAPAWGDSLLLYALSLGLFLPFALGVSSFFLQENFSLTLFLTVFLGEVFFYKVAQSNAETFQAHSKIKTTSLIYFFFSMVRFFFVLVFFFGPFERALETWGRFYLFSNILIFALSFYWANAAFGKAQFHFKRALRGIRESIHFAVNGTAKGLKGETDKIFLAHFISLEVAGFFALAQRLIELISTPIQAVLQTTLPRFFKKGEKGIGGPTDLALSLLPYVIAYGVVTGVGAYFAAPLIPFLVGQEYVQTILIFQSLLGMVLVQSIAAVMGEILTGSGFERMRSRVQVSASLGAVGLNLLLIPKIGWLGAVIATYCTAFFLIGGFVYWVVKFQKKAALIEKEMV